MRSPIPPTIKWFWHQPLLGLLLVVKPLWSPLRYFRGLLRCHLVGMGRGLAGPSVAVAALLLGTLVRSLPWGQRCLCHDDHESPSLVSWGPRTPSVARLRVWGWGVALAARRPKHHCGDPRNFWLASTGQGQLRPQKLVHPGIHKVWSPCQMSSLAWEGGDILWLPSLRCPNILPWDHGRDSCALQGKSFPHPQGFAWPPALTTITRVLSMFPQVGLVPS